MNKAYIWVEKVAQAYLQELWRIDAALREDPGEQERKRLKKLKAKLEKRIDRVRSNNGRANTLRMAHTCEGGIGIDGDELDTNIWSFVVANGVIDLRTGKLRNGRRDDYMTIASPVESQEGGASREVFEAYLWSILEDLEKIAFLKRWIGYCATGDVSAQKFLAAVGDGRNGKGALIEAILRAFGDYATSMRSEMLLDQGKPQSSNAPTGDILDLKGRRLVTTSESDEGRRFSPSKVKWLTGGDTRVGRYPHDKRQTTYHPTDKLILQTNNEPHAPADDYPFWDRLLLLRFPFRFVDNPQAENERKRDNDMLNKLLGELPGILDWIVEGAIEYQQQGLNPPESIIQAVEEYRREEDLVQDWLDENCIVLDRDDDGETPATRLYEDFCSWFRSYQGQKVPSATWFGRRMGKRFNRDKRAGIIVYFGIRLLAK